MNPLKFQSSQDYRPPVGRMSEGSDDTRGGKEGEDELEFVDSGLSFL
jgi:hypothetical protein